MAKRMTRMAAAAVAATCLTPLFLAGCATKSGGAGTGDAREVADARNAPITRASAGVARYRIRDWSALDDHTLIIVTEDGRRFRAETLGPCTGLPFTTRVGFVNRGGFNQIDRTSSVVLADGTRCPFQSFDELRSAESKALDSYEKASDGSSKQDSTAKKDEEQSN